MTSGRTIEHRLGRGAYCQGCQARLMIGEPRPSELWPYRLRAKPVSEDQVDLLLQAAAEFDRLGGGTAVEFIDWVALDALGRLSQVYPDHDGTTIDNDGRHSEPFPLPYHHMPAPRPGKPG